MPYKYKHFIPQNIAPVGAKRIVVLDAHRNVMTSIPLGRLAPPSGAPLYSGGVGSDLHLYKSGVSWVTWSPDTKFDAALTIFSNEGCEFFAHAGDITQTGFYDEGDTETLTPDQFIVYKAICDAHETEEDGCCGNHESYVVPIINNLPELEEYTGSGLYFAKSRHGDLFIYVGQPRNVTPMSDEALQWLAETLEANRNRRCFIFVHPHLLSGNPLGAYTSNPLFDSWEKTAAFLALIKHYKNTIVFHGHTHTKLECQEQDATANYVERDGRFVHIPSLTRPRDVVDGALVNRDAEGQAYIMDVYEHCVVLRGINIITGQPIPIGTYKIDTTLVEIPAGAFSDPTGVTTV